MNKIAPQTIYVAQVEFGESVELFYILFKYLSYYLL